MVLRNKNNLLLMNILNKGSGLCFYSIMILPQFHIWLLSDYITSFILEHTWFVMCGLKKAFFQSSNISYITIINNASMPDFSDARSGREIGKIMFPL